MRLVAKTRGQGTTVLERVAGSISRYNMFGAAEPVGVAVSGGADSIFLLYALRELEPSRRLLVLHLNHRLRGAESDADAEFVQAQAEALGLPFEMRSVEVGAAAGNLEEMGRRARLAFFSEVIGRGGIRRIATGHTLDDQAETVLYRLIRGAGTQGLRGILPVTREGLVRPLLECRRTEIEAWLRERGLLWREDSTNRDTRFVRNRIRHQILPELERDYNPRIHDTLARVAEIALDEEAYWEAELARLAPRVLCRHDDAVLIDVNLLQNLPLAIVRRLVRHALAEIRGDTRAICAAHVEEVLDLVGRRGGNGRIDLPGVEVVRSFHTLRIAEKPDPRVSGNRPIPLEVIERYNEGGKIDADTVPCGAGLRAWLPGDRLELSPGHTVKLKELFQRARIPVWERQNWPVLASGSDVIWTRRFGVGAKYAAGGQTRRFLDVVEGGA
jgi:tRNA(Ile)-lysidine synthase